jgi:hypothetical protein
MLRKKIIAVRSDLHTKHINKLCGQKMECFSAKAGGIYSYHWASTDQIILTHFNPKAVGSFGAVISNVSSLIFMYEHPVLQALHYSMLPVRA